MVKGRWNLFFVFLITALTSLYLVFRYGLNIVLQQHPTFQLVVSRLLLVALIAYLFNLYVYGKKIFQRPESPYNLAVLRLAIFAVPAWFAIQPYNQLSETLLRQWIDLPFSDRIPIPFMKYYSMHVPVSRQIVAMVQPVFLLVSITAFLGLFTRLSIVIYSILAFYLFSICHLFGKPVNNHYLLWFPLVLACCDCGKVLSVDSIIRCYRSGQQPDTTARNKYTIGVNAAIILLGILYFFPGFWKIWTCGLDWIFRYNLRNIFYTKWIELNGWLPAFRFDQSEILIAITSSFAVLFELVFIFWALARKHSWLLLLGGVFFHYGVRYFTQIDFTFLLPIYVCLFDWGKIAAKFKITSVLPQTENLSVNYPGARIERLILTILIGGNVLVGFTKTVSWPFACFPTFDYMVPEKTTVVYYEGWIQGKPAIADYYIRKQLNNTFSSYNVSAREYRALGFYAQKNYESGHTVLQALLNPLSDSLQVDSVLVYQINRSLKPEADLRYANKDLISVLKFKSKNQRN